MVLTANSKYHLKSITLITLICLSFLGSSLALDHNAYANDLNAYFGLLHGHTSYSDGLGTPDDAYESAKEAGLDFFAVTEHTHDKAGGSGHRNDGIYLTPEL